MLKKPSKNNECFYCCITSKCAKGSDKNEVLKFLMNSENDEFGSESHNESSFVHLTPPSYPLYIDNSMEDMKCFLDEAFHTEDIALTSSMNDNGESSGYQRSPLELPRLNSVVSFQDLERTIFQPLQSNEKHVQRNLCESCVEKLYLYIENQIERMQKECESYIDTIEMKESQIRNLKAYETQEIYPNNSLDNPDIEPTQFVYKNARNECEAMNSLREEIEHMRNAYEQQQELNRQYSSLLLQHEDHARFLSLEEDNLQRQTNNLELHTKNLKGNSREMACKCQRAQDEMEKLMNIELNSTLFFITDFQLSEKLRMVHGIQKSYPSINGLRLKYRANEDIKWNEINAAWGQIAVLLYSISGICEFSSTVFRLVPLTTCPRIIQITSHSKKEKKEHVLGNDKYRIKNPAVPLDGDETFTLASPLKILNHLLSQMIEHVLHSIQEPADLIFGQSLPFQISVSKIGIADLLSLEEDDELSWLYVVNCMVANIDWLSKCLNKNSIPMKVT